LEQVRDNGRWRSLVTFDASGPDGSVDSGRSLLSFAGNDYLGLSHHPNVVAAAVEATQRWGTGATASRLIVGTRPVHTELEQALADWKHCPAAVVFPTGYQANVGLLTALGSAEVTIVSDELNHASIIDGCRLARAATLVYRHNDLDHLAALLADVAGPALVVTDSVFSMDGDVAPVAALAELCARHGDALLVLDEAHAVTGPGFGPTVDVDDLPCPVVRIGTLSKALGAQGGFVAGPVEVIDLLVNRSRPLIYTTGLAPAAAAGALAALAICCSDEGAELARRLRANVDRLVPEHPSPIVAVIVGDERTAVEAAARLADRGLWVPAIRPPTVAPGTSRLRIALSADHTDRHLDQLTAALADQGLHARDRVHR
jgi:8-amino-7-oxononanoate synthase